MKNNSKPCSLKITGNTGRELSGTAAQLRYISSRGGWDQYVQDTYREIAQAVATQVADALAAHALEQHQFNQAPVSMESLMIPNFGTPTKGSAHVH